ncbi:RecQ family ATP-dependent DNA helicase [Candidatus Saccharibacteria bacterium]|nr:RecQ family ATP-dependent DNA helicase [Candidatus Saccharibacteria bacterium]
MEGKENRPYTNVAALNFPVELLARARASGFETVFMDTMALPADFFGLFNDDEEFRKNMESFAKWRIDFVPPAGFLSSGFLSEKETAIISVIEKIVNRGRLTRLSLKLEQEVFGILKMKDGNFGKKVAVNSFLNYHLPNIPNEWHDGAKRPVLDNMTAEEYFYKKIFVGTLGMKYAKDILPQVSFESLVIDKKNLQSSVLSQRVDFLITHGNAAIAVEIDDPTHSNHKEKDDERDKILEKNGLPVFRIEAEDLAGGMGAVPALVRKLKEMYSDSVTGGIDKSLIGIKLAHQFQMILIELVKHGEIKIGERVRVAFDSKNIPSLSAKEQNLILTAALDDLRELSHNVGKLYRDANYAFDNVKIVEVGSKADYVITVNDNYDFEPSKIIYLQDISYPLPLIQNKFPKLVKQKLVVNEKALLFLLNYIYRFEGFRPNQIDGIRQTIEGNDSIVLLPTGSGKSVVYQLLSYIMPGVAIVVDPITSLIEDQVDNLMRMGADRVLGVTAATANKSFLARAMVAGHYNLVFMSPERLQIEGFRWALKKLCTRNVVPVCAIDEAHCVSEWGHDFRTSYLNLANTCRNLLKTRGDSPCILALTGTASEAVLRDMERDLGIDDDYVIRPTSFDRKEIEFVVVPVESSAKNVALEKIVEVDLPKKFGMDFDEFYETNGSDTMSGIVFCPHVGGKYGIMQILADLHGMGVEAKEYSGKKPKNNPMNEDEWSEYKTSIVKQYKDNVFPTLVATKSFGMGIDKPNIRYTIHYGLPQSIEAFYQEAGRAGRDREKAYSYVIVSNDFPEHNKHLLGPSSSLMDMKRSMDEHKWNGDDVDRMLFFHTSAFGGIEEELALTRNVLKKIGDISKSREVRIASFQADREKTEKVIYRLSILGVVKDYTVDFSANEFSVKLTGFDKKSIVENYGKYVRGYQDDDNFVEAARSVIENIATDEPVEFVIEALDVLLRDFVYNIIERSRRSAFLQLLEVATAAAKISDEKARSRMVREEILRYLGNTHIDLVRQITDAPDDLVQVLGIVDGLSVKKQADLYAEVGRSLQAYPQHPGLLLARAYIRITTNTGEVVEIADIITAVTKFGLELYRINRKKIVDVVSGMMDVLLMKDKNKYMELLNILFQNDTIDREVLMGIGEKVPTGFKSIVMMNLLNKAMEELNILRKDDLWRAM